MWAPLECVTVTPATRFRKATSVAPGNTSPLQLAAVFQSVSPPPPSQHTPVQMTPVSVSRNTLAAGMNALFRVDNGVRVKLPLPVPVRVTTSKLWPASVKPLIRLVASVPPAVTLPAPAPDTATTSYCVPGAVPPMSASIVPVLTRLPTIESVPAAPTPPGLRMPLLVKVAVPRLTVPFPWITPALTMAWPLVLNVAPVARSSVPAALLLNAAETVVVPVATLAYVPLLTNVPPPPSAMLRFVENALWSWNVPLLVTTAPDPSRNSPLLTPVLPLHVVVPLRFSARPDRSCVFDPLIASPPSVLVTPAPVIVPPVHVVRPVTSNVATPLSVPPDRFRFDTVSVRALLTLTCPPAIDSAPVLSLPVPP